MSAAPAKSHKMFTDSKGEISIEFSESQPCSEKLEKLVLHSSILNIHFKGASLLFNF